jgi:hypothetical protein
MLKYSLFYFFIFKCFWVSCAFSNSYLRPEHLNSIQYGCYLEEKAIVFCTDQGITDPHVRIRLPLFEPIILENGVKAFRIMATVENNTQHNLSGARVHLSFGSDKKQSLEILISQRIIYKGTSSTEKSYLIRSDVPANSVLFKRLDSIYRKADISKVSLALTELIFEET